MNLLILPGGGSEHAKKYKPVYDLLRGEAEKRGYTEIQVAHYPGQADKTGKITGEGTLTGAVEAASKLIKQFAKKGPFRIIARSFGCIVAVLAVEKAGVANVKEIILWGPCPFWLIWKLFKKEFTASYKTWKSEAGVAISKDYFDSEEPIEYHLLNYTYDTPIIISTGKKDTTCTPSFFNYLKKICADKEKENIRFVALVAKATHTMRKGDPGVEEYLDTLFRDYIH